MHVSGTSAHINVLLLYFIFKLKRFWFVLVFVHWNLKLIMSFSFKLLLISFSSYAFLLFPHFFVASRIENPHFGCLEQISNENNIKNSNKLPTEEYQTHSMLWFMHQIFVTSHLTVQAVAATAAFSSLYPVSFIRCTKTVGWLHWSNASNALMCKYTLNKKRSTLFFARCCAGSPQRVYGCIYVV